MIPFDLEGYSEDRIAPNTAKVIKGTADLEEDLKKLDSGELTEVFAQWNELTWDDYEYECEILKTRIQG